MEHDQVTALVDVTLERGLLLLGGIGLSPQPVLDVNGPVGDSGLAADRLGETRAHAGTLVTEGRTEVGGVDSELALHDLDVLVVLPVDGSVVRKTLHLGVSVGVKGDLVTSGLHLLVYVGQVGGVVEEGHADGEEGDLDVLLADDLEDFLSKVWNTIIDSESEGVGTLASKDKVARLLVVGDLEASRNRGNDLHDGQLDSLSSVETLQRETDGLCEVNVEVADGDVDVAVASIAGGLDRVPGKGVGSNLGVTGTVVLLESDSELGGAGVSNVEVGALVLAEITARARDLGIERVISVS